MRKELATRKFKFNHYFDWTDFSLGFSIAKPNKATGFKLYLSLDLGFYSVWVNIIPC